MSLRTFLTVVVFSVALGSVHRVDAENRFWGGSVLGDGEFTDPDSWLSGVPTNNTTSDTAYFYGFFGGPWHTTVNLSASRSVAGIFFREPDFLGEAIEFTFTGSTLNVGSSGIDVQEGAGANQTINNAVGLPAAVGTQTWDLAENLRLNGGLTGGGDLVKDGPGTLTLAASNSNTGSITITEGTLVVTGAGRIFDRTDLYVNSGATARFNGMTDAVNGLYGFGTVELAGATLVIGNSINDSQGVGDFFGPITGSGGLTKRGPGTFTLAGDNTYSGATRVESGILLIENSSLSSATGPGAVTVAAGAALGGSGTAEGSVTVESGGVIFPGGEGVANVDRTDLLTAIDLTLEAGSTLRIDLGGTAPGDTFDVLAAFDASIAGSLEVTAVDGFLPSYGDVFQILVATSSLTGTFAGLSQGDLVGNVGGADLYIDYSAGGGQVVLLRAGRPGDFNLDGSVDGADILKWQRGELPGGASESHLAAWKSHFGTPSLTPTGTTAPEPAPGMLLSLAAMGGILTVRRTCGVPRRRS